MAKIKINETPLPGVGVRHEFHTEIGEQVGVITHHTGRRDLLVYDRDDPDVCRLALNLEEGEGRLLGELLGASEVTRSLGNIQQFIQGLAIDWIPITEAWACADHSISELNLTKTGVLIVAVIRNDETVPVPKPDFQLRSGDTMVVVGDPEGIRKLSDEMHG